MKAKLFLLTVVLLALVAGCEQSQAPVPPGHPCERPMMLVFTAAWCGPCQAQKPLVAQIASAGVDVRVYDIDEKPRNGKEVRHHGHADLHLLPLWTRAASDP